MLLAACGRPPKVTLYEDRHGGGGAGGQGLSGGAHTVARNESLYVIAQRYGVPTRAIIEANGLRPPYRLVVGQTLKLPRPRVHDVARGDTVYGISRRYGVAMNQIVQLNDLRAPYVIQSGQKLRLPGVVETRETNETAAADGRDGEAPPVPSRAPSGRITAEPLPPPQATAPDDVVRGSGLPNASARETTAPNGSAPGTQEARRTPEAAPPSASVSPKGFVWPVEGKLISGFGTKGKGLHNDGINLAAPRGTTVRAAQTGVVAYAGNELRGFGNLVLIKHSGGVMTAYAHNEAVLVKPGQHVTRGEPIAKVGSSGSVDTPQLHFEIRFGRQAVDPMKFLGTRTTGAAVRTAAFPGGRRGPG